MNNLYSTTEDRMDTVGRFTAETIKVWKAIKEANGKFLSELDTKDATTAEWMFAFELWLKDQYGIKLVRVNEGGYEKYEIVDQTKYLLFVLKFVK